MARQGLRQRERDIFNLVTLNKIRGPEDVGSPGLSCYRLGVIELPASLERRSNRESVEEDVAPYRGTRLSERDEILRSLCEFAAEQIRAHPRSAEILAFQDPRSPKSLSLWKRLVEKARRAG